jgi:tetratricopeptide (TPR) repeat protein
MISQLPTRKFYALSLALIIIVGLISSWPALHNGYYHLDDSAQIITNQQIRSLSPSSLRVILGTFNIGMYQPLATLSFAIEYYFWQLNPLAYHAGNIFLHLLNGCLVFLLLLKLSRRKYLAFAIAIFFIAHPVQVESVDWISARSNLLYATFFLSALIVYLSDDQKPKLRTSLLVILLFGLSLLSKVSAIVLPLVLVAIDYYRNNLSVKSIVNKIYLFALSAIFIAIAFVGKANAYSFDPEQYNLLSRLSFLPISLVSYWQKMLLPINLQIFYPYPEVHQGWLNSTLYLSWIIVPVVAIWLWRWRSRPLTILGASWMIITILPQLPWIPANQVMIADRYLYLPLIGFAMVMADLLSYLREKRYLRDSLLAGLVIILIASLIILSLIRHLAWRDNISLALDATIASPWSGLAYFHTANAYLTLRDYSSALAYVDHSIYLDPDNVYAQNLSAGISAQYFQDYFSAIEKYNRALRKFPTCAECYFGRAYVLKQLANYPAALTDLNLALQNTSDPLLQQEINQAIKSVREQLESKP